MISVRHALDVLHTHRRTASSLSDLPASLPVDLISQPAAASDPQKGVYVNAITPTSSPSWPVPDVVDEGLGSNRRGMHVLQPYNSVYSNMQLADILSCIAKLKNNGNLAWSEELVGQRVVYAIILKLQLKPNGKEGETPQPLVVTEAVHVCDRICLIDCFYHAIGRFNVSPTYYFIAIMWPAQSAHFPLEWPHSVWLRG